MTRTRRFLSGLAFGYVNQALVTLVGLWLTAFLIDRLGQVDYGLWLVGTRILGYLLLLDLGIVALLPRETAFAVGRAGGVTRAAELPDLVGRTVRVVFWQMPVVALAALGIWLALPAEWEPLSQPLAIVMGAFVLTFPARTLHGTLTGLQDLAFLGGVTTATWLVSTATTVVLIIAGFGLYALAIGWSASQVLAALIWWVRIRRRYPQVVPSRLPKMDGTRIRDRLSRGAWISVAQVAQVLLSGTDLLIIGKFLGPGAVVPYFCTAKVLTVLGHQPLMMAETAQPALSELRTGESRERLVVVCMALTKAILIMSGGIVCIVLVVNEGFVNWWVGPEQYGGFGLTAVLAGGMLLRHWNVTAVYSLFSFGHDRRISLTTLADGAVTVTASIVLVTQLGLIGAAIGAAVGAVFVGLPANLAALARDMGVSTGRLMVGLWPWAWRFALIVLPAAVMPTVWTPDSLATLVLATLVTGLVYAGLMFPIALRDPLGTYLRPRLARLQRIVLRSTAAPEVETGGVSTADAADAASVTGTHNLIDPEPDDRALGDPAE